MASNRTLIVTEYECDRRGESSLCGMGKQHDATSSKFIACSFS